MLGFSSVSALPGQACPIELFGVITRSGKEYPSRGSQTGCDFRCSPGFSNEKKFSYDRFYTVAAKTLQRLVAHGEGRHCLSVSVWSYAVGTGRLEPIVASTASDLKPVLPKEGVWHADSIPTALLSHLDNYYREGVTPPPVHYCDGDGKFVLILPATERNGLAGLTCLYHDDVTGYSETDLNLFELLSESLIDQFHTWKYRDNLRVEVRRREKQRIARDLQNAVVQGVAGAVLEIENACVSLTGANTDPDEAREHVLAASGLTRSVVKQLREMVWSLYGNHDKSEAQDNANTGVALSQ